MTRSLRRKRDSQRGVTAYSVILTVALLAILSHSLVTEALEGYWQAAQTRDTIALGQLTDSALAQAVYYLNQNNRQAASAPVRESFGAARIELADDDAGVRLRIVAHVPNEVRPRNTSRTLFRLVRDAQGRWAVVSAQYEPIPMARL